MTKKERDLEKQVTELYQTLRKDLKIKAAIIYTAHGLGLSVKKVEKILGFEAAKERRMAGGWPVKVRG